MIARDRAVIMLTKQTITLMHPKLILRMDPLRSRPTGSFEQVFLLKNSIKNLI